jgi:hypothetical protein
MNTDTLAVELQAGSLSLVDGEKLGGGGQAKTLQLVTAPGGETCAYKVYDESLSAKVNSEALLKSINWRRSLDPLDLAELDNRCAWPRSAVVDGDRLVGFLMSPAPLSMRRVRVPGAKPKLRHLEELLRGRAQCKVAGEYVEPPVKLAVLGRLVETVRWLHERGWIVGDVQLRNALFEIADERRVLLLDCDACVPVVGEPVLPQADPLDWKVPWADRFSRQTDYAKLAHAVLCSVNESVVLGDDYRSRLLAVVDTATVDLLERSKGGPIGSDDVRRWGEAAQLWRRLGSGAKLFVRTDNALLESWPTGVKPPVPREPDRAPIGKTPTPVPGRPPPRPPKRLVPPGVTTPVVDVPDPPRTSGSWLRVLVVVAVILVMAVYFLGWLG